MVNRHKALRSGGGAGALLVAVVLPTENGVDPTGFGRLTALAQEVQVETVSFEGGLEFNIGDYDSTADKIDQSVQGLIHLEEAPFKSETITIEIQDFSEIERKFIINADATLVYSWEVVEAEGEGGYYEFRGHPSSDDADDYPEAFEMAYSKGEGVFQNASFTTPFF